MDVFMFVYSYSFAKSSKFYIRQHNTECQSKAQNKKPGVYCVVIVPLEHIVKETVTCVTDCTDICILISVCFYTQFHNPKQNA